MKKILLVMMAVLCVASVSAQGKFKDAVNTVTSQKWSVGLRATYGVQVVAECFYSDKAYLEGRLGIFNGATSDFTVLHNRNGCNCAVLCCTRFRGSSCTEYFIDNQ